MLEIRIVRKVVNGIFVLGSICIGGGHMYLRLTLFTIGSSDHMAHMAHDSVE